MNSQIAFLIRLVAKEMWSKPKLTIVVYFISSIAFLTAAWVWPRIYTSTSVVLVDSESILSPLMKGTAVTTGIKDEAKRARQIILNKSSIEKILKLGVWQEAMDSDAAALKAQEQPIEDNISQKSSSKEVNERIVQPPTGDSAESPPKEIEATLSKSEQTEEDELRFEVMTKIIKASTTVENVGRSLIEINYQNGDPQVAFETASLLTDIFVNESINAKQSESRSAFEFIDNQVSIYQKQLTEAESAIKVFRSINVESTPGAKQNASTRLIELNAELETAELNKSAEQASIVVRRKQLRGELRESSSGIAKETLLSGRIAELEVRLSELLLSYKDTYPDVVQLRSQISTLKSQLFNDMERREEGANGSGFKKPTAQVAQEFKRQISLSENNITALNSRIEQLNIRIKKEKEILEKIISVEAEVAELTRDQTINQEMYNKLLSQRENARVSMNIDIQKQGQTMKIQEYASLPYLPKGLRFAHIILAGLLLSFLAPAGLVFVLAELDQKVRSHLFFKDTFKIPVLASIHRIPSITDIRDNRIKMTIMMLTVIVVWCIYAYAIYIKRFG